jgi:hypothetical protein
LSWVSGPAPLTDARHFNVTVGTHIVLLVNGRPRDTVYTAGRNGGIINLFGERRVPQFGDLQTMTFRSAVDVKSARTDTRLADGATIAVSADLQVKPAWTANERLLLTWVERYGANAATIERAADAALDADFAAMVTSTFRKLNHDQVHATTDKRSLLAVSAGPSGLLAIDQVLNVTCTRDPHAETAHNTLRNATVVAPAEAEAAQIRFNLSRELDVLRAQHANDLAAIRVNGELAFERARAANTAIINRAVAELYGLNPADVAYPQTHMDRQRILAETVRSVLTENADMLPLLAELGGTHPAGFLQQMFGTTSSPSVGTATSQAQGTRTAVAAIPQAGATGTGGQRWPTAPDVTAKLVDVGICDTVVGSAACAGPQGTQRIALAASGADRVVGGAGVPGSTNAVVVRERGTLFETVNAVLAAVAQWTGYTLGYKPVNNPGVQSADGGRLLINIDHVIPSGQAVHANAPLALAAWVTAINTLMADSTPRVTVSVLGQR